MHCGVLRAWRLARGRIRPDNAGLGCNSRTVDPVNEASPTQLICWLFSTDSHKSANCYTGAPKQVLLAARLAAAMASVQARNSGGPAAACRCGESSTQLACRFRAQNIRNNRSKAAEQQGVHHLLVSCSVSGHSLQARAHMRRQQLTRMLRPRAANHILTALYAAASHHTVSDVVS